MKTFNQFIKESNNIFGQKQKVQVYVPEKDYKNNPDSATANALRTKLDLLKQQKIVLTKLKHIADSHKNGISYYVIEVEYQIK